VQLKRELAFLVFFFFFKMGHSDGCHDNVACPLKCLQLAGCRTIGLGSVRSVDAQITDQDQALEERADGG